MRGRFFARAMGIALAVSSIGLASGAWAAPATLQNDGFQDGDSIGLQSGFVTGEAGAVTLGPINSPYSVEKIQLIFGPASGSRDVTLRIYLDDGGDAPGTMLYEGDYQLDSADDAMIEIDLSAEDVQVAGGSIRVALFFQHDGAPSIARDDDGSIQAGRNWIFTSGQWFDSGDFGLEGDWIIRAEVDTDESGVTSATVTTGATSADASSASSSDAASSSGLTTGVGTGAGATGSGATGGGAVCTPGETQACFGPGACQGGQSCLGDGTGWDACTCSANGDGGGNGDDVADGSDDDGCGCSLPGAHRTGSVAIALAAAAVALGASRRRRRT